MAITKTKNNTYRLRLYYPQDIQEKLGVNKLYSKTFKTRKEAKESEIDFYIAIKEVREGKKKMPLNLVVKHYLRIFIKKYGSMRMYQGLPLQIPIRPLL